MLTRDLLEPCPLVALDSEALAAARLLAALEHPYVLAVDGYGEPHMLLGGTEFLRLLLPDQVWDVPDLAVLIGPLAAADALAGRRVADCLPPGGAAPPVVAPNCPLTKATLTLTRAGSPLLVVAERNRQGTRVHGIVTARRLLARHIHGAGPADTSRPPQTGDGRAERAGDGRAEQAGDD
ncbi:hypothetical protein ACFQVC_08580 [Streptomyces monticola]|uniref:CBS domain-containing protein n=1 Tax=Streptomyces monticola TaxID=2666263 RepID=A0ABW2JFK4_9ACTN